MAIRAIDTQNLTKLKQGVGGASSRIGALDPMDTDIEKQSLLSSENNITYSNITNSEIGDKQLNQELNRMKLNNRKTKRRALASEQLTILIIILVTGIIYLGTFFAYLWVVHTQFSFLVYYPRISSLRPGSQVDQMTTVGGFWFWLMLLFSLFRLPVGLVFLWLMDRLGVSWKITVFVVLFIIGIILEITTLISTFTLWTVCNNPYFPTNMCNDYRYCQVYGNDFPDYCPSGSYTGLSPDLLKPREAFVNYIIFNSVFIALLVLLFIQIPSILDFKANSQRV